MGKNRPYAVLLLFVALLTVTACNAVIEGSGDLITETRKVSNFDRIDLSGSGEVIVTQGGSESLTIETDDNVMEHVKAEVEDGTLHLGFESGIRIISPSRLVFAVGVDDLNSLSISGSGDVESDRIETDRLEAEVTGSGDIMIADLMAVEVMAEISGSGEIHLAGDADAQNVSISGSGQYRAGDLCSESVEVTISGSGDATVCAAETLVSDISGSGSVAYYGSPSINSSGSGSGKINSLGDKQ
jgi:hypothetical protein